MRKALRTRTVVAAVIVSVATAIPPIGTAWARAPVIVAAGDIACGDQPCESQRRTTALIGWLRPRAVLTLGDNQYPDGALSDYRSSYHPTWGRFRGKTFPTPGNHEYHTSGARGYFDYFGSRARRGSGGWYSFDLGGGTCCRSTRAAARRASTGCGGCAGTSPATEAVVSSPTGTILDSRRAATTARTAGCGNSGRCCIVPASTWC